MPTVSPPASRRRDSSATPFVVVLLLVGVFAVSLGLGQITGLPRLGGWGGWEHDRQRAAASPSHIRIAVIDLDARVVGVGTSADGSIATPTNADDTGWYDRGPSPGENGTAVIVGHVDSRSAPAVFARLATVSPGTRVEVSRRDRHNAVFTVDSVERFDKQAFPASRVFSPSDRPRLVLVTCGGRWIGGATGYAENVIVFATLDTSPPP